MRDAAAPAPPRAVDFEMHKWLHDKFERELLHEYDLLNGRLGFFYLLQGVLIAAIAAAYVTTGLATYLNLTKALAVVGFLASILSWGVIGVTVLAIKYWSEGLKRIEEGFPPAAVEHLPPYLAKPFTEYASVFRIESHAKRSRRARVGLRLIMPEESARSIALGAVIAWVIVTILATSWTTLPHWLQGAIP